MVRENFEPHATSVLRDMGGWSNELDLYAQQNIKQGIKPARAPTFLWIPLIEGCQKDHWVYLAGAWVATVVAILDAWTLLERRRHGNSILDAAVSLMLQSEPEERIQLGQSDLSKVLKSQSALDYRRTVRTSNTMSKSANFLMSATLASRERWRIAFGQSGESATKLPRADLTKTKIAKMSWINIQLQVQRFGWRFSNNHAHEITIAYYWNKQQIDRELVSVSARRRCMTIRVAIQHKHLRLLNRFCNVAA